MNSIQEILPFLQTLIQGLAKHFGEECEWVVHDYAQDFEHSIVAIANGEVTGRKVGQGGTSIGLRVLQGEEKEDGVYNYLSQTHDGRVLRASTIYIKDDDGKVLGSVCVNYDISRLLQAKSSLDHFLQVSAAPQEQVESVVYERVEDLLLSMINDSIQKIGVPVSMMTREQKVEGIRYLKERGAFRIQKAGDIVAQYYDVSKYTIYNYLNELGGIKE